MNKFCFSTLGCPGWDFSEIFSTTCDLGFCGIEIRGIGDELDATRIPLFAYENIENTINKLAKVNISIPILTTNSALAVKDEYCAKVNFHQAREYIDLAARIKAPYIRIMSTDKPEPQDGNLEQCLTLYRELCEYAAPRGVVPLMETNGLLANSKTMLEFMEKCLINNCENIGVLWDIHHPYRFYGETPEYTALNIGKFVKHIHVKDSISTEENGIVYKMIGYGDVPVFGCLRELKKISYNGFISLEWAKRWNPDLQEPGIVFAHFANYIKNLVKRL